LSAEFGGPGLSFLPRFHGFDAEEGVLALEFLPARDLGSYQQRLGKFSPGIAAQIGTALAKLHRVSLPRTDVWVGRTPWQLSLHPPTAEAVSNFSAANVQLVKIVQAEFARLLDEVRPQWKPDAFIHSDLRWDNFLVTTGRRPRLAIIDWEFAGP